MSSLQAYSRSAGFLGPTFDCYTPDSAAGRANLPLRNVTVARLEDRLKLKSSFDDMRRDLDTKGGLQAMDAYTQRAVQFVTSREFALALDIMREPASVRTRYGIGFGTSPKSKNTLGLQNARFLLARRLIECGARCVNLTWEEEGERRWDTHRDNFNALRHELLPSFDIGLSAFMDDLEARGMLDDVMVLVWGEFGRTPRINKDAGRDHYAPAASALVFGGGLKVGQVIGSTNRYGERPQDRPIHYQQMFATLYRHLGIDPAQATVVDPNNRPQYLLDHVDDPRRRRVKRKGSLAGVGSEQRCIRGRASRCYKLLEPTRGGQPSRRGRASMGVLDLPRVSRNESTFFRSFGYTDHTTGGVMLRRAFVMTCRKGSYVGGEDDKRAGRD